MKNRMFSSILAISLLVSATACSNSKDNRETAIEAGDTMSTVNPDVSEPNQSIPYDAMITETETEASTAEVLPIVKTVKRYYLGDLSNVKEYDIEGKLIQETVYDVEDGHIKCYYDYGYDKAGNLITITKRFEDGEQYVSEEYEYDASGNMLLDTIYYGQDKKKAYFVYEYDDSGHMIKDTQCAGSGTVELWHEYIYDSEGFLIKDYTKNTVGGEDDDSCWSEYAYNSAGLLESKTMYSIKPEVEGGLHFDDWNGTEEYEYDAFGNITKKTILTNWYSNVQTETYVYEYDIAGNILKETYTDTGMSGNDSIVKTKTYEYDLFGNLIKSGDNTYEYLFF